MSYSSVNINNCKKIFDFIGTHGIANSFIKENGDEGLVVIEKEQIDIAIASVVYKNKDGINRHHKVVIIKDKTRNESFIANFNGVKLTTEKVNDKDNGDIRKLTNSDFLKENGFIVPGSNQLETGNIQGLLTICPYIATSLALQINETCNDM